MLRYERAIIAITTKHSGGGLCRPSAAFWLESESARGNGKLGAKNLQHADRQEGSEIQPEDIENATVSFTFDNPVSCAVVLEKLLVNMVAFRKAEKSIGPENSDLVESIKFLWAELLGEHDEPVAE